MEEGGQWRGEEECDSAATHIVEAFICANVACASARKVTVRKTCMVATVWCGEENSNAEKKERKERMR